LPYRGYEAVEARKKAVAALLPAVWLSLRACSVSGALSFHTFLLNREQHEAVKGEGWYSTMSIGIALNRRSALTPIATHE